MSIFMSVFTFLWLWSVVSWGCRQQEMFPFWPFLGCSQTAELICDFPEETEEERGFFNDVCSWMVLLYSAASGLGNIIFIFPIAKRAFCSPVSAAGHIQPADKTTETVPHSAALSAHGLPSDYCNIATESTDNFPNLTFVICPEITVLLATSYSCYNLWRKRAFE